jgi:PleD family two-component response regulator
MQRPKDGIKAGLIKTFQPGLSASSRLRALALKLMAEKPTLLIVDDEKTTREGLRAALEERYDVYIAEDAQAAMNLLESENFDVLLTDFRLPNEDGMKLIARQVAAEAADLHFDDGLRLGGTGGGRDETRRGRLHRQGPVAD